MELSHLQNCMTGGACGDCIGGPYEGRGPSVSASEPKPPWLISDDTLLSLATLEAIVLEGAVTAESIASGFAAAFSENPYAKYGASTLKALRELKEGAHWALSGRRGELSAGNGAAMRCAPLAFFLHGNIPEDREVIRDVCRITHHNDEAYSGALAVICSIQMGLPSNRRRFLSSIARSLPDSNVRDTLMQLALLPREIDVSQAAEVVGTSGYVAHSVPLALFAACTATSMRSAILALARCGGDVDSTASMCGQILGAWGTRIPDDWYKLVPCLEEIDTLMASIRERGLALLDLDRLRDH